MDNIHQIVISNTPSFASVNTFVDIIKPLGAKHAFICVDKFVANYQIPQQYAEIIEIHCDAVQNSYRYNAASNNVTRSDLIDTFLTTTVNGAAGIYYASFNIINNKDNWMEIDINRLPQLKLTYVSNCNGAYVYNLYLKIKFTQ
jgi:hypothetical protein